MATLPESRLRQMIDRFEQVEARMGVATDAKEIVQLSRDHAELKKIAEKAREVLSLRSQLAEAEQVIEDPGADRDFINMAIEERAASLLDASGQPLSEVLLGKAEGRTHADQITVFDSSGIALQDLTIARRLVAAQVQTRKST